MVRNESEKKVFHTIDLDFIDDIRYKYQKNKDTGEVIRDHIYIYTKDDPYNPIRIKNDISIKEIEQLAQTFKYEHEKPENTDEIYKIELPSLTLHFWECFLGVVDMDKGTLIATPSQTLLPPSQDFYRTTFLQRPEIHIEGDKVWVDMEKNKGKSCNLFDLNYRLNIAWSGFIRELATLIRAKEIGWFQLVSKSCNCDMEKKYDFKTIYEGSDIEEKWDVKSYIGSGNNHKHVSSDINEIAFTKSNCYFYGDILLPSNDVMQYMKNTSISHLTKQNNCGIIYL